MCPERESSNHPPPPIVDRQEIDRMQRVIKRVHSCLCDLKLAIDGTIVMSPALKESLDAMYDARIPETWMKVIPSAKKKNKKHQIGLPELSVGFKRCDCSPIFFIMVSLGCRVAAWSACSACYVRAAWTVPERGPK